MIGQYILDDNGVPIECGDLEKWANWYETADRKVAYDKIGVSDVSTVFLGLDHSFGSGQPVLYETLVFGGPLDGGGSRYRTKERAKRGYEEMVERVRTSQS